MFISIGNNTTEDLTDTFEPVMNDVFHYSAKTIEQLLKTSNFTYFQKHDSFRDGGELLNFLNTYNTTSITI